MNYEDKDITLKNGYKLILKSPKPCEAQNLINYLTKVCGETHFLVRYPNEVNITLKEEETILNQYLSSENSVMICAYYNNQIVGNSAVRINGTTSKIRHRATMGISILKDFQSIGLGTILMEEIIKKANILGFEQLELGVFEDNEKALNLYKKLGFKEYGKLPNAFKLEDNTYRDEIIMYLSL